MKRGIFVFISLLALTVMACGLSLPWGDDGQISVDEVVASATQAAEAAATANAFLGPLGEMAGTAVAQGDDVVATAISQTGQIAGTAQLLPTAEALATELAATVQAFATEIPSNIGEIASTSGGLMEAKLAGAQPDANGIIKVDVTEAEFNQIIAEQLVATNGNSPIQNPAVQLTGGSLVLDGDVTEPIVAPISVKMRPYVENGELRLDVQSAIVGGFPAFGSIMTTVEDTLNNYVTTGLLGLPANITLEDILISEGTMTILARQN